MATAVDAHIRSLDSKTRGEIANRLNQLQHSPHAYVKKLTGWENLWSSRVADRRILCAISDVVQILSVERVASDVW